MSGRKRRPPPCAAGAVRLAIAMVGFTGVAYGQTVAPTIAPVPVAITGKPAPAPVKISDILEFKALPAYHEPDWVTANFVAKGRLPPVVDRLPKEPLVFKTGNLPDGVGVYGDALRHVTGGRPEGWNYMAGQSQGWGGVDIGTMECLTRTGPLFEVAASDLTPLPNLARSWEWSVDGHKLTMHLVAGARWSDGVPFTSEDVMFYWEDNVLDPKVTPLSGTSQETFGAGTTLRAIDDTTIEWTFKDAFPTQYLYQMGYPDFCPGPAHLFKPLHPRYNPTATYDTYQKAVPTEFLNVPVMGAWVPVAYRPDDILVLRRNPYYWKVDEAGNQLPYLDEVQYRLSTWQARDIDAAAGIADFSNLEQPQNYVEALRHAADPTSPATLKFGPRTSAFSMLFNLSANGWGQPDARAEAVRLLNRDLGFRLAISSALDRDQIGQSLVKGPFTAPYPGGLVAANPYYDNGSTHYYPLAREVAVAYLNKAGLIDTDGDGWVNWPAGTLGGEDVNIVLLAIADNGVVATLAGGVVAQLETIGLRVTPKLVAVDPEFDLESRGQFDWLISRAGPELITSVENTTQMAPTGPRISEFHQAGSDGTLDLLPFESQLVGIVRQFIASSDPVGRTALMRQYQSVFTQNIYAVGLTQFPGALVVSKRMANVPPNAPILMFNWSEDAIMRERLFVPKDRQSNFELFPRSLPGAPGSAGPIY